MQRSVTYFRNSYQTIFAMVCGAVLCSFGSFAASNVHASIEQPEGFANDFEQLLSQIEAEESSSSSSTGQQRAPLVQDQQNDQPHEPDNAELLVAALSPVEGSTSSTSTTSSSGASGSGNTPIHTLSSTTTPDLALVGWTQGEARFSLPTPPGNDLLRPPQA